MTTETNFSGPWLRADLLNTPGYIASKDFMQHVEWAKGNPNVLMWKDDVNKSANRIATCAIVGDISYERPILELQGNYNPIFKNKLTTTKLQFQLLAPKDDEELAKDFDISLTRLTEIQTKSMSEGPPPQYFIVIDSDEQALRFGCSLFERRTSPYDPHDDEDISNDYPIPWEHKEAFDRAIRTHRITPMKAYNEQDEYINPMDLQTHLPGTRALIYFQLKHYSIRDKDSSSVAITGNTFSASIVQVKILQTPKYEKKPYKSKILKGPMILPQSPQKHSDQVAAVEAFHATSSSSPSKISSDISLINTPSSQSSSNNSSDLSTIDTPLSQSSPTPSVGQKRQISLVNEKGKDKEKEKPEKKRK